MMIFMTHTYDLHKKMRNKRYVNQFWQAEEIMKYIQGFRWYLLAVTASITISKKLSKLFYFKYHHFVTLSSPINKTCDLSSLRYIFTYRYQCDLYRICKRVHALSLTCIMSTGYITYPQLTDNTIM